MVVVGVDVVGPAAVAHPRDLRDESGTRRSAPAHSAVPAAALALVPAQGGVGVGVARRRVSRASFEGLARLGA